MLDCDRELEIELGGGKLPAKAKVLSVPVKKEGEDVCTSDEECEAAKGNPCERAEEHKEE